MRSEWEEHYANYIHEKYPNLTVRTNDRTIVPSRTSNEYLELDICIPELDLAFEFNGESYHDHDLYDQDFLNGTERSEEMYKKRFCQNRGITLIHIWSSINDDSNKRDIDRRIQIAQEARGMKSSSTYTPSSTSQSTYTSNSGIGCSVAIIGAAVFTCFLMLGNPMQVTPGWFVGSVFIIGIAAYLAYSMYKNSLSVRKQYE